MLLITVNRIYINIICMSLIIIVLLTIRPVEGDVAKVYSYSKVEYIYP